MLDVAHADHGRIEPFTSGTPGSWLAPELDAEVLDLRGDADLKRAVAELHLKFLSEPQALLHGDLQTRAGAITHA